jgi:hypothetical protein
MWVKDDTHIAFGQKLPDARGSEKRRVVVMKQPALSSPKFWAMNSHIFMQSP